MRIVIWIMFLALPLAARAQWFTAGRSLTDAEVPAAERAHYEKPALRFVHGLLDDDLDAAYALFADELRKEVPRPEFDRLVKGTVATMKPFADVRVAHGYRVALDKPGEGRGTFVCTATAGGAIDTPEGRVTVATLPVPLQAHVIVEAKARNNRWAFVLWLVPGKAGWRLAGFHIGTVTVLDRTETDVWKLARREQKAGRAFNAFVLYDLAAQLAARGPNLELGIHKAIRDELAALPRPPGLEGKPPFEWTFGKDRFHVTGVGPIGVGRVFDLLIMHRVAPGADPKELESVNRALIRGFEAEHPDYTEAFDGLVVRAVMPDGRGWGTVEQKRGE